MTNIELLKAMVEIDTTNDKANESQLALFLANYIKPYADMLDFITAPSGGRKNVLACFGNLKSKNILCFNGHFDVVSADSKDWDTEPFRLKVKNGLAYGRGTADMKGGIVASIQAIIRAKKDGLLKDKLVVFIGSVDEETGADSKLGAGYVVTKLSGLGIQPTGCIIPEPATYKKDLRINLGHRGLMWLKCTAIGKAMHSGLINTEDNAINNMMSFVAEVQKIITNQPKKVDEVPESSCRVVYIESGDEKAFNKVPDKAVVHMDVRTSPMDNNDKILEIINGIALKHKIEVKIEKNTPSASIKRQEKIVTVFEGVFKRLGENYSIGYASPTCDAHWFISAGIPTINGLGVSGDGVHAQNEFIEIESLNKREELFYQVIKDW